MAATIDNVQFRGFGTLSSAYSDSDILGFRRDLTQRGKMQQWQLGTDSVLGLQADMQLSERLKATVQLVGKDRVDNGLGESVEWAYLSYEPDNHWRIRLGRVGSDLTMIGDVGNVGYAYDWVRPPVEFYGAIPFYHFDGVEVNYRSQVADGYLSTKVFFGKSDSHFVYSTSDSDFDLSPFWGAAVHFEKGGLTFKAAYLYTKLSHVGNARMGQLRDALSLYAAYPAVAETIEALKIDNATQYYTSGISYRLAQWTWLAEASLLDSQEHLLPKTMAAYTGVVRRFDHLSAFGLLGHIRTLSANYQVNPLVPEPLFSYSQAAFNSVDIRQSTASLGVRWDVASNTALKLQWDHSWVTEGKAMLWTVNDGTSTPDEQVNTVTLSVSFVF
ncbi:hypothetical protein HR45_08640 [Shewanella mangrovi]|uniref:Porin domain-containing protein n=1 Tax=Shewanella mangrovi TaxID=1515746 RepID=A0A094JIP1_9GAMM|nr:hypothetical protein [Shewanella mangrovi]KFZ37899.1 hypothetical protein HR45_08640 [Shewanella mangrovi]